MKICRTKIITKKQSFSWSFQYDDFRLVKKLFFWSWSINKQWRLTKQEWIWDTVCFNKLEEQTRLKNCGNLKTNASTQNWLVPVIKKILYSHVYLCHTKPSGSITRWVVARTWASFFFGWWQGRIHHMTMHSAHSHHPRGTALGW